MKFYLFAVLALSVNAIQIHQKGDDAAAAEIGAVAEPAKEEAKAPAAESAKEEAKAPAAEPVKEESKAPAKEEAKTEAKEEAKAEEKTEAKTEAKQEAPVESAAAAGPQDFDTIARSIPPGKEPKKEEEKIVPAKEFNHDPFVNTSGAPIAPPSMELGNGDHWTADMPDTIQNGGAGKHHWSTKMNAQEEKAKAIENNTSPEPEKAPESTKV